MPPKRNQRRRRAKSDSSDEETETPQPQVPMAGVEEQFRAAIGEQIDTARQKLAGEIKNCVECTICSKRWLEALDKPETDVAAIRSNTEAYVNTVQHGHPEDCTFHETEKAARRAINAVDRRRALRLPTKFDQSLEALTGANRNQASHLYKPDAVERALQMSIDMLPPFEVIAISVNQHLLHPMVYLHASKANYLWKSVMKKYTEEQRAIVQCLEENMVYCANLIIPEDGATSYIDNSSLVPLVRMEGKHTSFAFAPNGIDLFVLTERVTQDNKPLFALYRITPHPRQGGNTGTGYDFVYLDVPREVYEPLYQAKNRVWTVNMSPLTNNIVVVSIGGEVLIRFSAQFDHEYLVPAVVVNHWEHPYLSSKRYEHAHNMVIAPVPNPAIPGSNFLYVLFRLEAPSATDLEKKLPPEVSQDLMDQARAVGEKALKQYKDADIAREMAKKEHMRLVYAYAKEHPQLFEETGLDPNVNPTSWTVKDLDADNTEAWACAIYDTTDIGLVKPILRSMLSIPDRIQLGNSDPVVFHTVIGFYSPSCGHCVAILGNGSAEAKGKEDIVVIHRAIPEPVFTNQREDFITVIRVPGIRDVACIGDKFYYINEVGVVGACPVNEFSPEARHHANDTIQVKGYWRFPNALTTGRYNNIGGSLLRNWRNRYFIVKPSSSDLPMVVPLPTIDKEIQFIRLSGLDLPTEEQRLTAVQNERYVAAARMLVISSIVTMAETEDLHDVLAGVVRTFEVHGLAAPSMQAAEGIFNYVGKMWHQARFTGLTKKDAVARMMETDAGEKVHEKATVRPSDPANPHEAAVLAWIMMKRYISTQFGAANIRDLAALVEECPDIHTFFAEADVTRWQTAIDSAAQMAPLPLDLYRPSEE